MTLALGQLIGMVHVGALPGTPRAAATPEMLAAQAAKEATQLAEAGFDAVIIENMHDTPYLKGSRLGPEITATMTRVAVEVATAVDLPLGVQILSCGNRQAVAVAHAAGFQAVRCENFVFSHVADEGLLPDAEAGELLRYRRGIGADGVALLCDIKKKHASHALTADISIADAAEAAAFFGADALIVTGAHTAKPVHDEDLRAVRNACELPIIVGSGATSEAAKQLLTLADAVIVGSAIKHEGDWKNPIDPARAAAFVEAARA
ncbi:MAG: BtpA/SgcQ family protein [Planctomycetota bacterium]